MKEENKREVVEKNFPDEQLFMVNVVENTPWYADYVNFIVAKIIPWELSSHQRKNFFSEVRHYYWDEPLLFKHCADGMVRKCVPEAEMSQILKHCHELACGGHHGGNKTAAKVLQSGFYWPSLFHDAYKFVKGCEKC